MDFSIPLVFFGVFIVACLSLLFVYKYGMKEKSYEEALAEQRQQTHALLGVKAKPKDKKPKKPSKKQSKENKGKPVVQGHETDESENAESNASENGQKVHVEFKEEPEEVPIKEVVQVPIKPKRIKKVRPILIKKDKSPEKIILDLIETPIANHFEENPPKDDFELMRSNSRDDIAVKEKTSKEKKANAEVVAPSRTNKKQHKQAANSSIPPASSNVPIQPAVVEKENEIEEKIIEPKIVEPIQAAPPLTNGIIGNPGKEKKKKKSEYNTMQQLTAERDGLINSVRKAELSKNEIQLLIDLLLNKQLEAPAVIDEWSEGKSDPVQKLKKQLAEKEKALAEEKEALISAQGKLKEVRAEQQSERIQLQQKLRALDEILQNKQIEVQAANNRAQVNAQKIQQLQGELNNEVMKVRKLMEDNGTLQIQIQQIKENDALTTLRNNVEELSSQNQQLLIERQQILRDKEHQHQQFLVQMREMEKELEQIQDISQQLKESKQLLERDFNIERTNLNDAVQQQYNEKVSIERTLHQKLDELRDITNEKMESVKIIAQLNSELKAIQDQLTQTNGAVEDNRSYEVEILNLSNELSSVKSELNSMKNELQRTESKYKLELDNYSKIYQSIQKELDEQKVKNNNLTVEIKSKEQEAQKQFILRLFPEIVDLKAVSSEDWQEEFGTLIKNYIKNLKSSQNKQSPLASPQQSQDVAKLQNEIQRYKKTIDDTELMLKELQLHVEQAEMNWRNQLAAKDLEIEQIKETRLHQLENKVASLEQQLAQTLEEKQRLKEEFQLFKSHSQKTQTTNKYSDPTATIEQLSEENNRLKDQLRVEQNKNGDINICLKAQNNFTSPRNGAALIEVPTIRNSNICSNMGCQFLYCDGNSCQSNL